MLEAVKFYLSNHTDEVRTGLYMVGAAIMILAFNTFKDKLIKTGRLLLTGIGEILAILVVMPVTVVVVVLDMITNILTVILTISTGVITVCILTVNLIKALLQDLTTYIVKNYGEEK